MKPKLLIEKDTVFYDASDKPFYNGLISVIELGTSNFIKLYLDIELTTPFCNPIPLDSEGKIHSDIFTNTDSELFVKIEIPDSQL